MMKKRKETGVDEVAVKYLKEGDECVNDWLIRIFGICMHEGKVTDD